jgi:hypothetical protein
MLIPSNVERLRTISDIVREELDEHVREGGAYYDERAGQIAARAIQTIMPGLVDMQGSRVVVEAERGIAVLDDEAEQPSFAGVSVEAQLQRVSIQQAVHNLRIDGSELSYVTHDLFAVLTPRFLEPDPVDIVFTKELYIPFGSVENFDPADTK